MGCSQSKSGKQAAKQAADRIGERTIRSFDTRMRAEWAAGDKNGDGSLSFKEVKRLMKKLNVAIPERELKKEFDKYDKDGNKELDFDEFQKMFQAVQSLPDLLAVFKAACGNQDAMVAEELQRYMTSSSNGKVNLSIKDCVRLILLHEGANDDEVRKSLGANPVDTEEDQETFLEEPLLSYDGFLRLMTDPMFNSAMDQRKYNHVYQDMDQPLSHYFISSSHNSYLSGNQLSSESTPAAISKALKLGVRVIELDAWDGPNGQPIVNHGHTMCKPTSLEGCLRAISEDGFKSSEYPVIITIENHCSVEQQKVQMDLIESIFGDKLYRWDGAEKDGRRDWTVGPPEWASPQDLKGRVVIRDKPQKKKSKSKKDKKSSPTSGRSTEDSGNISASASLSEAADRAGPDGLNVDAIQSQQSMAVDDDIALTERSIRALVSGDGDDEEEDEDADYEAAQRMGTDERLLRVMYIKNVKIKSHISKERQVVQYEEPPFRSSSSLGESKMLKLTKPGFAARDLAAYAQRHLVRVYPAGSRVDSSNYDPNPAWAAGAQVVALNYQTNTMPTWLNQGKFSDNGGSGYVLKPDFLQTGGDVPSPWSAQPTEVLTTVKVTVISGHYLPKPLGKSEKSEVIDPYVEVSMFGVEADYKKCTTKHIDDNGFNPTWNETFSFACRAPELALLSFVVNDHDLVGKDDFIGQRVLPLTAVVPGHKVIPLNFDNGAPQDSYLFVRIQFSPSPPTSSTD